MDYLNPNAIDASIAALAEIPKPKQRADEVLITLRVPVGEIDFSRCEVAEDSTACEMGGVDFVDCFLECDLTGATFWGYEIAEFEELTIDVAIRHLKEERGIK